MGLEVGLHLADGAEVRAVEHQEQTLGLGMSAFRGEADEDQRPSERPLIARSGHSDSAYWLDEEVTGFTRSALSSAAVYNCLLDTPIPPKGMNGALAFSPRRR